MALIPMVTVEYHDLQDFRCTEEEYKEFGGFAGVMRMLGTSFKMVSKVKHELLPASEYPTVEWES